MFKNCSPNLAFFFGLFAGIALVALLAAGFMGFVFFKDIKELKNANANTNQAVVEEETPLNLSALGISDTDHIYGNNEAKVTLVEFSDLQCSFCNRFHPNISSVVEKYKDNVRWVYKHFPLSFHANAQPAAIAAECAGKQGKFFEYISKLFEKQKELGNTLYESLAAELGLNTTDFRTCLSDSQILSKVKADYAQGVKVGVQGTPATVLIDKNDQAEMISGYVTAAELEAKVKEALE